MYCPLGIYQLTPICAKFHSVRQNWYFVHCSRYLSKSKRKIPRGVYHTSNLQYHLICWVRKPVLSGFSTKNPLLPGTLLLNLLQLDKIDCQNYYNDGIKTKTMHMYTTCCGLISPTQQTIYLSMSCVSK